MTSADYLLTLKYAAFSVAATILNVGAQYLVIENFHHPYILYAGIMAGTTVGLLSKYLLDKRFIFYADFKGLRENAGRFFLYSLMGVLTTIQFWVIELAFDLLVPVFYAKYVGAVIGLSLGYLTKYHLDKKYVFGNL